MRSRVEIHAGDRIGPNFELDVGDLVDVVTVEGNAPVLKTENATHDYTVDRMQLEDFRLNRRSCRSFRLLSTGTWRPDVIGKHRVSNPTPEEWYEHAAFEIPRDANGVADFDCMGRNTMQEDGIFNRTSDCRSPSTQPRVLKCSSATKSST